MQIHVYSGQAACHPHAAASSNMSWRVWMDILALELYFSFPFSKYYIRIYERDDCSDLGNYNYSLKV